MLLSSEMPARPAPGMARGCEKVATLAMVLWGPEGCKVHYVGGEGRQMLKFRCVDMERCQEMRHAIAFLSFAALAPHLGSPRQSDSENQDLVPSPERLLVLDNSSRCARNNIAAGQTDILPSKWGHMQVYSI